MNTLPHVPPSSSSTPGYSSGRVRSTQHLALTPKVPTKAIEDSFNPSAFGACPARRSFCGPKQFSFGHAPQFNAAATQFRRVIPSARSHRQPRPGSSDRLWSSRHYQVISELKRGYGAGDCGNLDANWLVRVGPRMAVTSIRTRTTFIILSSNNRCPAWLTVSHPSRAAARVAATWGSVSAHMVFPAASEYAKALPAIGDAIAFPTTMPERWLSLRPDCG